MDPAELDLILNGLPQLHDSHVKLGYSHKDDAAVYELPSGELLVQTVDYFTPVVDDPYDFGAIAAANSLSDIYAMNARPLFALNICCFPRKQPAEIWHEVLRGGAEKAMEAGIPIVGGHTIDDAEPKYGLVVTGIADRGPYWANNGAQVGDSLILTKPIGTGIITTALKNESITADDAADAILGMKSLNRTAADILSRYETHACTDITGNGLIGHASEILEASQVGLELFAKEIPLYRMAAELSITGKFPGGTFANRKYYEPLVEISPEVSDPASWLLFDAQTSGGLLAALPTEQAQNALSDLRQQGISSAVIVGRVGAGAKIFVK
jgi:selenium donor protein